MIIMKGFFLFIVINTFVWNSIVYAGKDQQSGISEYVKEFNIEDYMDKVFIISNLFPNKEHNKNYSYLMYLAKKYYKTGFRVLAFQPSDQLHYLTRIEDESKRLIDLMNDNKIEIIDGDKAREFWESINNDHDMKYNRRIYFAHDSIANENVSGIPFDQIHQWTEDNLQKYVYHSFLVDRNNSLLSGYLKNNNSNTIHDEENEWHLIRILEPWNYIESMHEIVVKSYNGVSVQIKGYMNRVLIFLFIHKGSTMENEKQFQSLLKIVNKINNFNLNILLFIDTNEIHEKVVASLKSIPLFINQHSEIDHENLISDNISESIEAIVHIFQYDVNAFILKQFFNMKIQGIEYSRQTVNINEFMTNKNGNIFMVFKVDSSEEEIKKMLTEHVIVEDMNTEQ